MFRLPIAALVLLHAAPVLAAGEEDYWYNRKRCIEAADAVFSGDLKAADAKITAIEASRDNDDQACGVYLRIGLAQMEIAIYGRTPAVIDGRARRIARMAAFAKAHEKYGLRFADLMIEARMRRVYHLIEDGERTDGLSEARRVKEMLAQRKGPETPTLVYVVGTVNGAVGSSPLLLRTVLGLAGVSGDSKVGASKLKAIFEGSTIYKWDALYVMRTFAEMSGEPAFGPRSVLSEKLVAQFPKNPQFMYDRALDLRAENACAKAIEATAPGRAMIEATPGLWTNRVRAKLYYITGACALATGDKPLAKKAIEKARAEAYAELDEEIEKVEKAL